MSFLIPEKDWFKAPDKGERNWIAIGIVWCLIMSVMMPYWHVAGKQNSRGESYKVKPEDFSARVQKFVETNSVGKLGNIPIVQPNPGGHAYLMGGGYIWYPILKLKQGQKYTLHISSTDYQHGFSVQPINMNFQILPGYDHVLEITPTSTGEFNIVCNEFCGARHHVMTGKIIVE
ncbi:MAG: cytochrome C oxidase subunit II [Spirochaetia bacterium]|nr:cytochrome C oxidase subunit II [Spirochaetia bacterium]